MLGITRKGAPRVLRSPAIAEHIVTSSFVAMVVAAGAGPAVSRAAEPLTLRTRTAELHYRLVGTSAGAEVELWYTRDRGVRWTKYGIDPDGQSPFRFEAPAEGLYGLTLVVRGSSHEAARPPQPHDPPQRWVFIDYTPPLLQWRSVLPTKEGDQRIMQFSWTAHDDHLLSRPVTLSYQSSVDQQWKTIAANVANAGRYDWNVPADTQGTLTFKISVRDQGGHVVERMHGPVSLAAMLAVPVQPAADVEPTAKDVAPQRDDTDRTLTVAESGVSMQDQRRAEELYKRGSWHLVRGQYDLAAERIREALQLDPQMLDALTDLAGIHYLQNDYGQAIALYNDVLKVDGTHGPALRGSALAYVAKREYAKSRDSLKRLLEANGTDAKALLDLGDVLFMMGDRTNARARWDEASQVNGAGDDVVRKAQQRLKLYGPSAGEPAAVLSSGK